MTDPQSKRSSPRNSWRDDLLLWIQSLKISGMTFITVGLVVFAALAITPNFSTYLQQQREISQLRQSVEMHRAALTDIEGHQIKWQDPVYIRAQARERLYYVMPGEVQLTVVEDGVIIPEDGALTTSTELVKTERNWTREFAVSILGAGTTTASPEELFSTK